jgi:ubiquinone/menaquinone biosynthesis C-methylase UbiE
VPPAEQKQPETAPTAAASPPAAEPQAAAPGDEYEASINKQYGRDNLGQQLLDAVKAAGKDPDHLTLDDIAGFSHFHALGAQATKDLAAMAKIKKGDKVIDLGSGLGGPAMVLAHDHGADVTAVELTQAYHDAAQLLASKVGVTGVKFVHANALAVPEPDHSFDVVWMQHVEMNIQDKPKLFSEIVRLLKPHGRFVTHSILRGKSPNEIIYPVPWADDASRSFMSSEEEFKKMAADAGLKLVTWKDTTAETTKAVKEVVAKMSTPPAGGAPPPLGLNLLMTTTTRPKFENTLKDLEDHRLVFFMAVFESPK